MSDFLQQMARLSAERADAARRSYHDSELDLPVAALKLDRFDVIAELKRNSPAEGQLADTALDPLQQASRYAAGGAAAVSVLTEPSRFAGSLDDLRDVAAQLATLGIPAMRKDFLVDKVQLLEARAAGASGALLIAAMLDDATLAEMLDCARELRLFVLLEAFDEADLARCSSLLEQPRFADDAEKEQLLIGVNTRNLRTLKVDNERLQRLADQLPAGAACVAESGLRDADDAAAAASWGYRLALVGSALMRHDDPATLIRSMCDAGRSQGPA